jgi:hypothetical protein
MLPWVILVLVVLFLAGTLLTVRPSKRQLRIARLRREAARQGLELRLAVRLDLPEPLPEPQSACLIWHRPKDRPGLPGICLLETSGRVRPSGIFLRREDRLGPLLSDLPAGVQALVSAARYVALCWDESGDEESLRQLKSILPGLEELTQADPV